MCGICGMARVDSGRVDVARVEAIRDAMSFRGPDAAGVSAGDGYALGHRRLSIIDLSDAGKQPMRSSDGDVEIVLNGEIYNFADLRPELERAGHQFISRSDTEVLLHGFETWGLSGLLARIRGMYAFAIVDRAAREIHLARDPLGKKPLYFRYKDGELVFASSARAIARGLGQVPEIDPVAVRDLVREGFISGPRTIFRDFEKVPPGSAVTIRRDGSRVDQMHWRPDFSHPEEGVAFEQWVDRIDEAVTHAVQRRLVADVPVGIMLSGGVDSSLITAIAARLHPGICTYSTGSDDPRIDETQYATAVAAHCGTTHEVLQVGAGVRETMPALIEAMGEPLGDSAAANLLPISLTAVKNVKVVLTGDGGDEAFGGYSHFLAAYLAGETRRLIPPMVRPALQRLGTRVHGLPAVPLRRAGTFLRMASESPRDRFLRFARRLDADLERDLFTDAIHSAVDPRPLHYLAALDECSARDDASVMMEVQMRTLLVDQYLAKADVATMGASLEARSPLLDVDVVELASRIPASIRFRNRTPKALLRALARRYVPAHVIDRPKRGWLAPVQRWLATDWPDVVDRYILGPHIERRGWFRRDTVERLVAEHRSGIDRSSILWSLLVLEWWLQSLEESVG